MKLKTIAVAAVSALAVCGASHAALFDRGVGLIYDSTQNLTWLADMNYAQTHGDDGDGLMSWTNANAWAESLTFGGYSDWRLPTLNPYDTSCSDSFDYGGGFGAQYSGGHCTGGELSHLFVADLGNKPFETVLNQAGDSPEQMANFALFSNLRSSGYWSGTSFSPTASNAWFFISFDGSQAITAKQSEYYAVAVRLGDVATPVPEPGTLALSLLGLCAFAGATRRGKG